MASQLSQNISSCTPAFRYLSLTFVFHPFTYHFYAHNIIQSFSSCQSEGHHFNIPVESYHSVHYNPWHLPIEFIICSHSYFSIHFILLIWYIYAFNKVCRFANRKLKSLIKSPLEPPSALSQSTSLIHDVIPKKYEMMRASGAGTNIS